MNSRLRKLLMPLLLAVKEGRPISFRMRSAARQAIYLIEKPVSLKKTQARARQQIERQSARASHNQETAKIWFACDRRAEGRCECGCGIAFASPPSQRIEMDHFYGRARGQSIETSWMLISIHHRMKTENDPSREHWDRLFAAHCAKHGYPFKGRLIHADRAKAGGAP